MRNVEIVRLETSNHGTFGTIKVDKKIVAVTLEPPENFNQKNISCIPVSQYKCSPYRSSRYGQTFIIESVPGRSGILFHAGNYVHDTDGCILVGNHIVTNQKGRCLVNSRDALTRLLVTVGPEAFHLTVHRCY